MAYQLTKVIYLALRFSVLEFTSERERQPIRGYKHYLSKNKMAWAKIRGGDLKQPGRYITFAWPGSSLA
jgi:hypothetical protein